MNTAVIIPQPKDVMIRFLIRLMFDIVTSLQVNHKEMI